MKVIAVIEDAQIIKNPAFSGIKYLGLWEVKRKMPPRANAPPLEALSIYDDSPAPCVDDPPSSLFLRRDKLSDPAGSGVIQLTCRGVVRRTKTETYL